MRPVLGARQFVAILCVAGLLAGLLAVTWNPASIDLLCAVLVPLVVWLGFVWASGKTPRPGGLKKYFAR